MVEVGEGFGVLLVCGVFGEDLVVGDFGGGEVVLIEFGVVDV